MNIFILLPLTDVKDWPNGFAKEGFIVRAENKDKACELVCKNTLIASKRISRYDDTPLCPWEDRNKTICIFYDTDEYEINSKEEILKNQQYKLPVSQSPITKDVEFCGSYKGITYIVENINIDENNMLIDFGIYNDIRKCKLERDRITSINIDEKRNEAKTIIKKLINHNK